MSNNIQSSGFKISGILIISLIRLCSFFPLRVAHGIGSGVGALFYYLSKRTRHTTLSNLKLCFPELNSKQRVALAKQTLKEAGKTLTEMGALCYWPANKLQRYIHIDNQALWDEVTRQDVRAKSKGVMILCPHLGCWEIVNLALAPISSMTSLYRPPRIEALNKLLLKARTRSGGILVPTTHSGVKALFSALRNEKMIGILPDQDPGKDNGIFVPFFKVPTNTMPLAGRLIQKAKPRAYLVYGQRLGKGKGFNLVIEPAPDNLADADQQQIATAINQLIEKHVALHPSQYQWTYKRFKYQPDGKNLYAENIIEANHE